MLSFDVDFPRDVEVLPEVSRRLADAGVAGSFACIGRWVRTYPGQHQVLVEDGHEILNHTQDHPNLYHPDYDYARGDELGRERFNDIGPERRRQEIEAGHQTLEEVLGITAEGFRTPHFGSLHVDDVYPVLADLGYRFSSSTMAWKTPAGVPYRTGEGVWELPVSPCPDHPLGVFDSWHALGKSGGRHARPGELAGLFDLLLSAAGERGGFVNVYFDPCDMLGSGELERVLDSIRDSDMPFTTYGALCRQLEAAEAAEAEAS